MNTETETVGGKRERERSRHLETKESECLRLWHDLKVLILNVILNDTLLFPPHLILAPTQEYTTAAASVFAHLIKWGKSKLSYRPRWDDGNGKAEKGGFFAPCKTCTIYAQLLTHCERDQNCQKCLKKARNQTDQQTDRHSEWEERERENRWNLIQRMNEGRCVYQMVAAALQTGHFIFTKFITHPQNKRNIKHRIRIKKS